MQKPKLIVISGAINSGKTTTSSSLAEKLTNTAHIHGDSLRHFVTWQDLEDAIPITYKNIFSITQNFLQDGYNVVIDYPFYKTDFQRLVECFEEYDIHAFVLTPPLEIAQSQRGERVISQQEVDRIAYHYQTNLHNPDFGIAIDNSKLDIEETVEHILTYLNATP